MNLLSTILDKYNDVLMRSVVPIFINEDFDKSIYGSSLFVQYKSNFLLVTAAHVVDDLGHDRLFYRNGDKLVCNVLLMNSANGKDTTDLALIRVPDEIVRNLKRDHIVIELDNLDSHVISGPEFAFLIVGFPYTKNKFRSKVTRTRALTYIGNELNEEGYAKMKSCKKKELILEINQSQIMDIRSGTECPALPSLKGISGGGVWCIGNFSKAGSGFFQPYPVGIVREIDQKNIALMVSRIQYIIPGFEKLIQIETSPEDKPTIG